MGHSSFTSGSMPSAQMVDAYEKLHPGSINRFFLHAEKEIMHRHEIEISESQANIRISERIVDESIQQALKQIEGETYIVKLAARAGILFMLISLVVAIYFGVNGNNFMASAFLACSIGTKLFTGISTLLSKTAKNNKNS